MAIHLEDVLARRVRCLFLDAQETQKVAPQVARIMADAMNKSDEWMANELTEFYKISQNYIL
jgi:glycerol-3-phosphate dehydrogenase